MPKKLQKQRQMPDRIFVWTDAATDLDLATRDPSDIPDGVEVGTYSLIATNIKRVNHTLERIK